MDQFISRVIKVLQRVGDAIWHSFKEAFDDAAKQAVVVIDGLSTKYLPMAMKHVQDLLTSDLSTAEKRSVAFTKISQELQADGMDVMASGFDSFVNLLIELALNTLKALQGTSIGSSDLAVAALKRDSGSA